MREPFKIRFKHWLCKVFGHRPIYSHTFNGEKHYTCKRCKSFVNGK